MSIDSVGIETVHVMGISLVCIYEVKSELSKKFNLHAEESPAAHSITTADSEAEFTLLAEN